jgi:hypothetical protein
MIKDKNYLELQISKLLTEFNEKYSDHVIEEIYTVPFTKMDGTIKYYGVKIRTKKREE